MKLKELNQTNIMYFEGFDPFSILQKINDAGRIVFGALDEEEDGYDLPVGMAICTPSENDLRIEWLYIAPEYQSRGFGSELFYQLSEFAWEQGYQTLSVYLIESGLQHAATLGAKTFFKDQGLTVENTTPGEWRSDLGSILSQPFFEAPSIVPVLSLDSLSEDEVQDISLDFQYDRPEDILHPIDENESVIKKELSFLCRGKQDTFMGALLMSEMDGELFPLAFYAENKEIARSLFANAFQAAKELYGKEIHFTARLWQETYVKLMNDMMPEGHFAASILSTDLKNLMEKTASMEGSYGILQEELPDTINISYSPDNAHLPFRNCKEMSASLGKLKENPFFADSMEVSHFEPLSLLNLEQMEELIGWINARTKGSAFDHIPKNSDYSWLDADLSCMIREDGEVVSAFLVGIDDLDQLFPLALYSLNNIGQLQICEYVQHVFKNALDKYGDEKQVNVRVYNATVKNMCRKIMG